MTLIDFLVLAVVAAICGMIGESLAGYSVGGCLVSAVIGYVGAFVGLWVARQFASLACQSCSLSQLVALRFQ